MGHEIIIGDAANVLKDYPEGFFQLVVTSPPYPMIEQWDGMFAGNDYLMTKAFDKIKDMRNLAEIWLLMDSIYQTMHEKLAEVWLQLNRVLIDGGIACIVIGDATRSVKNKSGKTIPGSFRLYPNHATTINYFTTIGFNVLPYILWKKPTNKPNAFLGSGFVPPNGYITMDIEYILLFRKGKLRKFPPNDKLRYQSNFSKDNRDKWFSQIWEIPGAKQVSKEDPDNRTGSFPLEIPKRLVRMFSIEKDWVCDPFAGTGTTGRACKLFNRYSVNIDIEPSKERVMRGKIR